MLWLFVECASLNTPKKCLKQVTDLLDHPQLSIDAIRQQCRKENLCTFSNHHWKLGQVL